MLANPEPHVLIRESGSESAVFQCHSNRPNFLPIALAELLEMQGRMFWIGYQQRELLVGPGANVGWKT